VPELPYRLCAIDLDDTLLGPDHTISERSLCAVQAVVACGATVVLASGRMHEAMLRYIRQLELTTPMISYNGAMVKNPLTGEEWLHERIRPELAQIVMDFCQERDLQLNFYANGVVNTVAYTPWMQLYHERTGCPYEIVPDLYTRMREVSPTKLIIVNTLEYTNSLLPVFRERFGDALYITKSTDEYLEFMPATANKGAALALIADHFGVAQESVLAFGDSYNDIPMLRWAGTGLAVGNAKPEVLVAADRIIGRYDEDGVAQALEEIYHLD